MAEETNGSAATRAEEIAELKRQMEEMQRRLEQLSAAEVIAADEEDVAAESVANSASVVVDAADAASFDADSADAEDAPSCNDGDSASQSDAELTGRPGEAELCEGAAAGASDAGFGVAVDEVSALHAEAAVDMVPATVEDPTVAEPAPVNAYGVRETEEEYTAAAVADFMPQSEPPQPAPPVYGVAAGYASQAGQQNGYAAPGQPSQAQQPPASPYGQQPYAQQPGQAAYYQQPGNYYSAPQGGYAQPQGGYQSQYQQPLVRTKDHVAAGLLAIFLGVFGVHKFYLGYNTAGFILLGVTILGGIFTFGIAASVVWLIGIIEGVMYLTKSQPEFEQIYVFNKREWF